MTGSYRLLRAVGAVLASAGMEDGRYRTLRAPRGPRADRSFFQLQALFVVVVSLPYLLLGVVVPLAPARRATRRMRPPPQTVGSWHG
jgi:hypothetical protein